MSLGVFLALIPYDLLVTSFCLLLAHYGYETWRKHASQRATSSTKTKALRIELFCKLVAYSASLTMASAHKTIVRYGW